ncbi:transposable element Tc1 transposase [Trichonephila clavipes]|nr:transposable element Tc1 transposase [Trichonephila clavipes]
MFAVNDEMKGLEGQDVRIRLTLIPRHQQNRLQWCSSRLSLLPSDRHRIVFSDGFSFTVEADDHRLRAWTGQRQRSQSAFVLQRYAAIIPDVMVWGAISYDSRSSLVILHTSLIAQRYVKSILRLAELPFIARHSVSRFQQDISRFDTARISVDYPRIVNILLWSASSPELSPIEHVSNGRVPESGTLPYPRFRNSKMLQIWSNI